MELGRNKRFSLPLCVVFFAGFLSACSRSVPEKLELKIGVPLQNVSQSPSTLSDDRLEFVIINLRATPTSVPKVIHFEAGRDFAISTAGAVRPGDTVTLTVKGDDIPVSTTTLIQYLGGFKNSTTGGLRFSYGDTTVNTNVNGVIPANIQAIIFGASSGKEVEFGGRYKTSATGGPTGGLMMYFQPPTVGVPQMAVERREMIDGWFTAFALEDGGANSPRFTYKLTDAFTGNETTLWSDINSASAMFSSSDPNSYVRRWSASSSFRISQRSVGYELEAAPGGWFIGGYWATSPGFLDNDNESVRAAEEEPFALNDFTTELTMTTPLPFYGSDTTGYASGVQVDTSPGDANTSVGEPSEIIFNPRRLGQGGKSDIFGFKGVFKTVNDDDRFYSYLKAEKNVSNNVDLTWSYLPLSADAVNGAVIFYKSYSGGWGNEENNEGLSRDKPKDCFEKLTSPSLGYTPYLIETSGVVSTIQLNGPAPANTGGFTQAYGYSFAVCPFKSVAGKRHYYPFYARTDCLGGCTNTQESMYSFGEKIPGYSGHDAAGLSAGAIAFDTALGGEAAQIINKTNESDGTHRLYYNASGSTAFEAVVNVGDEMLVHITGANTSCGMGGGVGAFDFAKVEEVNTGSSYIRVKSDGFMLKSLSTGSELSALPSSASFCYVQMVRVPHFGDLSLPAGSYIEPRAFNYDQYGGGIVALRVNGALTFGAADDYISAVGKGYPYGYQQSGSCRNGLGATNTNPSCGSGIYSPGDGGGGGAGAVNSGGHGETNSSVLTNAGLAAGVASAQSNNMDITMQFGAAGGSASYSSGGNGGGAIFIAARKIAVRGANGNTIKASGANGSATASYHGSGGGGGGSVNIYSLGVVNTDVLSGQLKLAAYGGNGGQYAAMKSGGGGGGGHIIARVCNLANTQKIFAGVGQGQDSTTTNVMVAPMTISGGAALPGFGFATSGLAGYLDNRRQYYLCQGHN